METMHHLGLAAGMTASFVSLFFGTRWFLTSAFFLYGYVFSKFEHATFWLWYIGLLYLCHIAGLLSSSWLWIQFFNRKILQNVLIWSSLGVLFSHSTTASAYTFVSTWILDVIQMIIGLGLIVHELGTRVPWFRHRSLSFKWLLPLGPIAVSMSLWLLCVWNEHSTIAIAEQQAAYNLGLPHATPPTFASTKYPSILPPALSSPESVLVKDLSTSGFSSLAPETPLLLTAKAMHKFEKPRSVIREHITVLYCEIDLWLEEAQAAVVGDSGVVGKPTTSVAQTAKDSRRQINCGRRRKAEYAFLSLDPAPLQGTSFEAVYDKFLRLEVLVGDMIVTWEDGVEKQYTELYQRLNSAFTTLDAVADTGIFWLDNAHAMSSRISNTLMPLPLPRRIAEWSAGTPYGFGVWWQWFKYFFVSSSSRRSRKSQEFLHTAISHATKALQDENLLGKATDFFHIGDAREMQNAGQIFNALPNTILDVPTIADNFTLHWRLNRIKTDFQVANSLLAEHVPALRRALHNSAASNQSSESMLLAADLLSGNGLYGFRARPYAHQDFDQKKVLEEAREKLGVPRWYKGVEN